MLEDVNNLLSALGITVPPEGGPLLVFICSSVQERICNETNQDKVPDGLHYMAVEMAVGEYLRNRKNAGQLEGIEIDVDAAVKSIQEGDTNITFAVGEGSMTPEQRLESLIEYLINGRTKEFIRYRRLLW